MADKNNLAFKPDSRKASHMRDCPESMAARLRRAKASMEEGKLLKKRGLCREALHSYENAASILEDADFDRASRVYKAIGKGYENMMFNAIAGIFFEKAAHRKELALGHRGNGSKDEMAAISGLYADATFNFLMAMHSQSWLSLYGMYSFPERALNSWFKAMEFSQDKKAGAERLKMMMGSICNIVIDNPQSLHDIHSAFAKLSAVEGAALRTPSPSRPHP